MGVARGSSSISIGLSSVTTSNDSGDDGRMLRVVSCNSPWPNPTLGSILLSILHFLVPNVNYEQGEQHYW